MTVDDLEAALGQCVRCGRCLPECPVYRTTLWEGSSARGKLSLLKADLSGRTDLSGRMKDLLSHCLQCGACAKACASGVKGDHLIRAGRALAFQESGWAGLKSRLTRDILGRGRLAQGLWNLKPWFLQDVPSDSGLHFRFPLPDLLRGRWMPAPAAVTFLDQWARVGKSFSPDDCSGEKNRPRVALFVGCVANYLRPQTAWAAVRLIEAAGGTVVVPEDQACCGKPAFGAGDDQTAQVLAARNIEAMTRTPFDYVVTFCATCSEHLKEYQPHGLDSGRTWPGDRVVDLSVLLGDVLEWKPVVPEADPGPEIKVFYHDPCHLRRKQGVFETPRRLVGLLPGVELVGADEPPVCCGYGGLFNLWHYDLSQTLFQKRIRTIEPYAPDLATSSCSGCWLQFKDGLAAAGRPFDIKPLAELLAERGLPKIRSTDENRV